MSEIITSNNVRLNPILLQQVKNLVTNQQQAAKSNTEHGSIVAMTVAEQTDGVNARLLLDSFKTLDAQLSAVVSSTSNTIEYPTLQQVDHPLDRLINNSKLEFESINLLIPSMNDLHNEVNYLTAYPASLTTNEASQMLEISKNVLLNTNWLLSSMSLSRQFNHESAEVEESDLDIAIGLINLPEQEANYQPLESEFKFMAQQQLRGANIGLGSRPQNNAPTMSSDVSIYSKSGQQNYTSITLAVLYVSISLQLLNNKAALVTAQFADTIAEVLTYMTSLGTFLTTLNSFYSADLSQVNGHKDSKDAPESTLNFDGANTQKYASDAGYNMTRNGSTNTLYLKASDVPKEFQGIDGQYSFFAKSSSYGGSLMVTSESINYLIAVSSKMLGKVLINYTGDKSLEGIYGGAALSSTKIQNFIDGLGSISTQVNNEATSLSGEVETYSTNSKAGSELLNKQLNYVNQFWQKY